MNTHLKVCRSPQYLFLVAVLSPLPVNIVVAILLADTYQYRESWSVLLCTGWMIDTLVLTKLLLCACLFVDVLVLLMIQARPSKDNVCCAMTALHGCGTTSLRALMPTIRYTTDLICRLLSLVLACTLHRDACRMLHIS
jgi:hypothetical protein